MPASSPEEIEKLCKRVISGEFQDEENIETASQNFGVVICSSFKQPSDSLVSLCSEAMLRCLNFPEYKDQAFCSSSIEHCIVLACARAQEANNPEEIPLLLSFIVRNFTFKPSKDVILFLGNNLSNKDSSLTLIKLCLEALSLILEVQKSSKTSQSLLVQKLLPLHSIQGKISPTQSLLGEFHRELTLCVAKTSSQVGIRGWEQSICDLSTSLYPNIGEGNSPKEVLILHELETLLTSAGEKMLSLKARACLCTRLLSCIQSLHGMVCERALSFWKSDLCFQLLQGDDNLLSKTCEASLVKASLEHWSPTVRNMAGAALLVGNPVEDSSSDVKQAVQQAKANQERLQNSKPLETLPLPKTFSSTSVIRDAIEPFASGAFGVIWKGRAIIPGTAKSQWPVIVLKEIDSNEMAQDEIEAMRRIGPHPHLVELLGVYETNRKVVHLVLEFIDGPGDLHTIVCERNFLSVELCQWIAAQIGSAIQHIHSQGWVFGDIKPENILLTNDGQAKLCDFGACFISGKEKVGGTIEYLPPEQVPSFQGDWWSFGCVLHFMLTGKPPVFFNKVEEMDLTSAFARAVTFADQRGGMWIKDSQARNLVAMLCDRDPKLRPKDGGESHQFFSKLRPWEGLFKSRREEMPKLPKALKSSSSATTSASSPWQRRTFSMMHSPLPKAYKVLDAGFLSSCIVKGRIIPEVEWTSFSNSSLGQMFTEEREAIPKSRIAVVATVQQNQGGKSRKVVKANYSVGGIDLTAG